MAIFALWPEEAIYIPWWIWLITWSLAGIWSNRTMKTAGLAREFPYRIIESAGFVFLLFFRGQNSMDFRAGLPAHNPLVQRFWVLPPDAGWVMLGLVCAGVLFAWWARIHLGRLWSGVITRKEGHRIVDTGPYAIVRHPIYTGLILAALATAAERANLGAILGTALLIVGFWIKAKQEERFLRAELGPADYDAYRKRVPLLVPFGPK